MSTTIPPTETPPTETPPVTPPETPPTDQAALVESLRKQNEDLAAALRQSTISRGLDDAPQRQPVPAGPSLQDQLAQLDSDERYMHLSPSQKAAIAAQMLYERQVAPQAAMMKKQMAQNAVMMFKQMHAGERDASKILPYFDQACAKLDELANLDADGLQNYLDGVWLQAVGLFYRNAQATATPPREEPVNLGGGGGGGGRPGPVGTPTPQTLTIDQIDDKTVRLGRQLGWDDERIVKAAQRALEQGDE